jgi:hypothetical protein
MSNADTWLARWSNYRPSKKLWIWSIVGSSCLTIVLGFTLGGWVPAGRATVMADIAARDAKTKLVSSICVQKFVSSADAAESLAMLKKASSWQRAGFIENGGWMTIAGVDDTVPGAADLCAVRLLDMKELPEAVADAT